MFCPEYDLPTWLAYLNHAIQTDKKKELENHLEHCSLCLAELLEINRLTARMISLEPTLVPTFLHLDTFTLALHQAKETIHTLLGHLSPLPLPITRNNTPPSWEYVSQHLNLVLTIKPEPSGFSLTIAGPLSSFTLYKDKPIFQGSIDENLTLTHLSFGNYTLSTDKGKLNFTIQA